MPDAKPGQAELAVAFLVAGAFLFMALREAGWRLHHRHEGHQSRRGFRSSRF